MKNVSSVLFAAALAAPLALSTVTAKAENLVDTAVAAGNFETLLAAVKAAGMEGVLTGDAPYTVFAPTDEAFAKLPEGTLEDLLKPENRAKLTKLVSYHVVPGKVTYEDLRNRQMTALTFAKEAVNIDALNGGVRFEKAMVVGPEIVASNGVIHVIDSVVLPE
jgi:uncharacterized surface protein with fasciclin (FAS1) repeats